MRSLPVWSSLGLVSVAVILVVAAFPSGPFPWLAWIALVPFFLALPRVSPVRALLLGGLLGWAIWFGAIWWVFLPLRDILGLASRWALMLVAAGCLLNGLAYGVAAFFVRLAPPRSSAYGAGRDAAIFTVATTFLIVVFPGNLAHSQYQFPAMLQVLELGGVPLLLFFIYLTNRLVAEVLQEILARRRFPFKVAAGAVAIPASIFLFGVLRIHQVDAEARSATAGRHFTVGAIQPNIPIGVPTDRQPAPEALGNSIFTAMQQARDLVEEMPQLDLIAFPENPETFFFNEDGVRRQAVGQLISATGKPVFLNVDGRDSPVADASDILPTRYNVSVFLNADRQLAGSYLKMKRIPLVEYLPGEPSFPWLRKRFPASLNVAAGEQPVIIPINDEVRVIPLICYEAILPSFTREFVHQGGNLIVNQVNDSWFGRTRASEIHLALALCRTVENRVPMVRVTNSGVGAHIEATGRIVPGSRTELYATTATAFSLFVPENRSVYARIGNWWMAVFLLFLPFYLKDFRGRRHEEK